MIRNLYQIENINKERNFKEPNGNSSTEMQANKQKQIIQQGVDLN